jgi:hypothetical protein
VRGVGDVDPLGGADPRHCLWHTGALLVSAPPPVTQPVTHPVTGHRTGHAARSGGERVCGLAPVRATRPARGGATGSGCTEPNHGARWGVRAGRLVRRFAGMHRAKKGVRTCLQSGLAGTVGATRSTAPAAVGGAVARGPAPGPRRVRVRYGYTQDPRVPLFKSEWQRGTERTKMYDPGGRSERPARQSLARRGSQNPKTLPPAGPPA